MKFRVVKRQMTESIRNPYTWSSDKGKLLEVINKNLTPSEAQKLKRSLNAERTQDERNQFYFRTEKMEEEK